MENTVTKTSLPIEGLLTSADGHRSEQIKSKNDHNNITNSTLANSKLSEDNSIDTNSNATSISHNSTSIQPTSSNEVPIPSAAPTITGRKAARSLRIFRGVTTAEEVKDKIASSTSQLEDEVPDLRSHTPSHSSPQDEAKPLLDLEPVSSATYFPHTPADPMKDDILHHKHHHHHISSISSDHRHHSPKVISPTAIIPQTQHLMADLEFDHSTNGNITKILNVNEATEKSKLVEIEKTLISLSKSSSPSLEDMKAKQEPIKSTASRQSDDQSVSAQLNEQSESFPLAVELRPFKNKVGGHTAIFSFSKRAVCKALMNRENLFYETVELRHPELLNFMPRYIGVLNVRYSSIITENSNSDDSHACIGTPNSVGKFRSTIMSTSAKDSPGKHTGHSKRVETLNLINSEEDDELPPEVVLDDNKHIIPDSLWKQYSSSLPSPVPDSFLDGSHNSLHNSIHNSIHNGDHSVSSSINSNHFNHHRVSSNLGSTSVNTDLQVQVLQEVFQPTLKLHNNSNNHVHHPNDDNIFSMDDDELGGKPSDSSNVASPAMNPADAVNSPQHHPSSGPILRKHTRFERFILLEDLTSNMKTPCVLDLKMGTRQYGIDANASKQKSQRRKCLTTTSRSLGVRICGLQISKKPDAEGVEDPALQNPYLTKDKYFGRRIKIGIQFCKILAKFLYNGQDNYSILIKIPHLITQFDELYQIFNKLNGYRMYGSSILLMYDGGNNTDEDDLSQVKVRIIDFAQSVIAEEDNRDASIPPSHPDFADLGYLRGIKSLITYFKMVFQIISGHQFEDPAMAIEFVTQNKAQYMTRNKWLDDYAEKENETDGGINEVAEGDPFNVEYPQYSTVDDEGISE
ncbi:uncharacterized protein RJT20DRAFT_4624 [Scheffersomyces xylosifermentans]|uniref:uncharacterized protein n=1 Tax=Scheffersomyces xylosifermentans TaxID=1304137 RepID=UPI00315DC0F0